MPFIPQKLFNITIFSLTTTSVFATSTTTIQTSPSEIHQLSPIIVSASGFEQNLKDAPASISLITKEDIEKKNATTIADLLTDIPGVDVRNGVGKTSALNVNIRGMKSTNTLILIDGRRQTTSIDVTPNAFGEVATAFLPPLSTIERIEVIRGPMSTLYGSDAIGGVINIITKKVTDEWRGNITLSGNAMENRAEADSWKTSFSLNGPIVPNKLGMQLRGSYFNRGASDRVFGTKGIDPRPHKAHQYEIGSKLDYTINDQNNVWMDVFFAKQFYKNDENRLGTVDTKKQAYGYKDELEFTRQQFAIGHEGEYDFGQWKTYISQIETETKGRTLPSEALKNGRRNPLSGQDRTLKNTDVIIDSHIIHTLDTHKFTLGSEFKDLTIQDNIVENGSHKFNKKSWSIYAEDEWSLKDNLIFTYGTRYERHSSFGGKFSPRAYLVWNANDLLTIKGGVSTGYKVPSPKELHDGLINFGGQGTIPTIGNSKLKPETSVNYELGFNFQPTDQLNFTATAFHNVVSNAIVSDRTLCSLSQACLSAYPNAKANALFNQKYNSVEAQVNGLETSLEYKIIPEWEIKAAYTFMKTEITKGKNKGGYYTNVPRHAFNLTSTWHIHDDFNLWLQHEYKSNRTRFPSTPIAPKSGLGSSDYEEYKLFGNSFAGYSVFNLGASYSINEDLRLNVAVNNLLNKDFTEGSKTYAYKDAKGKVQQTTSYKYFDIDKKTNGTFISGRNYWLSLSYDF
jgi:outer membrane receptor for ferrienterochelin and colicins